MKNLVQLSFTNNKKSILCNCNGLFTHISMWNEDYICCPFCDKRFSKYCNKYSKECHTNYDDYISFYSCIKCNILFTNGCYHIDSDGGTGIFNVHLINKYKYKNDIYEGMPFFENNDEFNLVKHDIEILQLICPNNGDYCKEKKYKGHCCELTRENIIYFNDNDDPENDEEYDEFYGGKDCEYKMDNVI